MSFGDLRSIYSEARSRSVASVFTRFLDDHLNISSGIRSQASTSQTHLREFLDGENGRDEDFPRILSIADADFLGGSFARHTKPWPLDDIDVYVPIDAGGLVYMIGGVRQLYTPLTDDVLDANPLLIDRDRWMKGPHVSSRKLINEFAKVLRRHYPDATPVRRVGEAVNVLLSHGANNECDGMGFDVVPCFSLQPQSRFERQFYLIPDGDDGWIRTNPKIDQELCLKFHKANERTLRPAVKLFKYFNGLRLGGHVKSYYAELAIMRAFQQHNWSGQTISTTSSAVEVAFRAVRDAINTGDKAPLIQNAPMVEAGKVTIRDMERLNEAVDRCNLALLYESLGRTAEAIATWHLVFGHECPEA